MDLVCLERFKHIDGFDVFGKVMAPFGGIAGWALLSRRDAASESRSTSKNRKKNIEPNENMTDTNKKRIHKKIMSTCHLLSLSCGPCIHTLAFASFLAFASSASFLAFANAFWWQPTGGWEAKGLGKVQSFSGKSRSCKRRWKFFGRTQNYPEF